MQKYTQPLMTSFEEIIATSHISVKNNPMTVSLLPDTFPEIESVRDFREFTRVCEMLELPTIDKEMLDTRHYCRNMVVYLMNMSSVITLDLEEIVGRHKKIEECLEMDRKIDELEVRLANLKSDCGFVDVERSVITQEIDALERIKGLDRETLFSILRNNSAVQRLVRRDALLQKIHAAKEGMLKNVLSTFIEDDFVSIGSIENLGVDRITALKLVYQLCSKGIVTYDQQNDLISMNK